MSNGVKTVRRTAMSALALLAFLGGIIATSWLIASPAQAIVGTNEQINFQGRLFNAQGAVVPDGYYNIQFKIYQDGTGQNANNPGGTLRWTENYLNTNSQGVQVKNGYMSVDLGSVNPFGTQVDWNQSVLWLSMNIGNTNTSCANFAVCGPDGEMTPMKRLSSSVYALNAANANKLDGLTSADFIRNQNASAQATTNFWIDGTGRATSLTASTNVATPAIRSLTNGVNGLQFQNTAGTATIMNIDTLNSRVGIGTGVAAPSATLQVAGTLTSAGGAISLNDSSNFTVSIGGGSSTGSLTIGNASNTTALGSNTITIGSPSATTLLTKEAQTTTNATGTAMIISGATGNGTGAGGQVTVQGGNGGASNANGGNLRLSGGTATGTGISGLVVVTTPTFQTAATDANCYAGGSLVASSCTITATSVNNNSAIIVGFSTGGQTATLPNPGISTAGRIIYITAAGGSQDFTLAVNGGGVGNQIAMRQNTTATMIWNGSAWTAAGASSSTTLQAAYDNTIQSPGGAELLVSKTASTNGLTIRDSSTNPVNGTLLSVQSSSASSLLSVNSNVVEYATNGGAETPTTGDEFSFPANTWSLIGSSGIFLRLPASYNPDAVATGKAGVAVVTGNAANVGARNRLSTTLTANTTYNVSFAIRGGSLSTLNVHYSANGTAFSIPCATNQTVNVSVWTKINCTFTTPASGITADNSLFISKGDVVDNTLFIDNLSVTIAADYNFATDGSVNNAATFSTNWSYSAGIGTGAVSRNTTDGEDASDSAQVAISSGAVDAGVRNRLSSNPLTLTQYRITVYAKLASGTFNDFKIRYSPDNGASFVDCLDYNTRAVTTTQWTKITCYLNTTGTTPTQPYVYFVEGSAAARTFMVDNFSMTLRTLTTPNVQVGGGIYGGPTTLFTLDKGASAPIASDNDALLGSMYYDTTLGKLQCYEADGWGACGSSPDNIVTISPEYTNAVMHGTGVGTMTSDLCSDTLNINDGSSGQPTICATNETYNFYKWTSPQPTSQGYGIYVTYQLPSTFKSFASGSTSLMGRTDSANSSVSYQIYRSDAAGLTSCGGSVSVSSGVQSTWQIGKATGAADPSTCGFAPGNSIVFKINMAASSNANAYIGNLGFTFTNR